jgi:phosphoribosylanthranilate isomerase
MMVKICGITNAADCLAAAGAGASAVGFNFYPRSPRYVSRDTARELAALLPAAVLRVGVFVDTPPETVIAVAEYVGLDIAQLHGGEAPVGLRVWRAFRADRSSLAQDIAAGGAEAFLIDTPSTTLAGGTGTSFDWSIAAGLPGRIVLAGGLHEGNVGEAIRQARPWGVDACSRIERVPGKKDHEKMRRFVSAALSGEL